jgi:RNase P subunit RPR2
MAKVAKTADRQKVMDTSKSTDCPKCNKPTRIVKRVKDRERGVPGGVYISCSGCDFYEKMRPGSFHLIGWDCSLPYR